MQSEVISLEACFWELVPTIVMVDEVGAAIGLPQSENLKMYVCIHKENAGALVLAQKLTPRFIPACEYYTVKTHWFREKCIDLGIAIQKISMVDQLEDICNNCLLVSTFHYLRKKLMDW